MTARLVVLAAFTAILPGQEQPAQQPETKPAEAQAAPAEAVPPAIREQKLSGEIEVGHRWVQEVDGNREVYRSLVNLGEGPKLLNGNVRFQSPGSKLIDNLDVRGNSWGGEPYSTLRVEAGLAGAYRFEADYRNLAYFNSLPSFANPLISEGLFLSQRAIDLRRKQLDSRLEIIPGAWISPYLAFSHNSGDGRGVTTFVVDGNEFPVSTGLRDSSENYRGGLQFNFSKLSFTLEHGGTAFKDDQQVFFSGGGNRGNRRTTLFGRQIVLDDLREAYGARGSGIFSRAAIQGRPWSRLDFTGQFLYSQPDVEVRYEAQTRGEFFLLSALAPYSAQLERSAGEALRPHPSGSWSTEIRPFSRLRIVQSWYTDRFHVSASSLLAQSFNTTPVTTLERSFFDLLALNYNQHQVDAIVDILPRVTLRGGHRYVWGDARVRGASVTPTPDTGELKRHVALAGAAVRPWSNLDVYLDLEASPGDRTYFRTDLMEYQRGKIRGRYRIRPSLTATAAFAILNNQNTAQDVNLDLRSQQSSVSLYWTPNQGKRFSVLADYTRSTLRSDLPFLEPQSFQREISAYRDRGHHGGAYGEVVLTRGVRLSLGGSYSVNTGSRPTRYYQPQAQIVAPIAGKIAWTSQWRWFGFTERRYAYENFHTHMFSTGLRLGL